ncbi:lysine-specific histone demethylase 1-like protein 1-like [Hibiscus syriacus]|uniref:Lysine-specific histone demethylase 1-like protein 1-like n=1 Tax=Hibiscus syriacus TaxID=106335 RepID=A0A6A3CR24_HIBSY|nr:lysine-specific histone demethylase 1-like protein 1-like [Hibiscus syriacus]
MAEEHTHKEAEFGGDQGAVESKDRGVFDFLGKKEEENPKPKQEALASEFEKVKIEESKAEEERKEGEKKPILLDKLHRSGSSSSSSSDEEEGEGGEKKDKKRLKEKTGGEKKDETAVPVEKSDEQPETPEKKGFIDKIKEKLPGQHKKDEEDATPSPPPTPATVPADKVAVEYHEEESNEKKGLLAKIKEKIPGYHTETEEEKETTASH